MTTVVKAKRVPTASGRENRVRNTTKRIINSLFNCIVVPSTASKMPLQAIVHEDDNLTVEQFLEKKFEGLVQVRTTSLFRPFMSHVLIKYFYRSFEIMPKCLSLNFVSSAPMAPLPFKE